MKWGDNSTTDRLLTFLIAILAALLAIALIVRVAGADEPSSASSPSKGYDVYRPGTGMAYNQPQPNLTDGTVFQFCQDDGGAMWRCTSATVRDGKWVDTPRITDGYTDVEWSKLPTVWHKEWVLQKEVTEVAPNPVLAYVPGTIVHSTVQYNIDYIALEPNWFNEQWLTEFLANHDRQPTQADYQYRYETMLRANGG